jgi:hypothetical protein
LCSARSRRYRRYLHFPDFSVPLLRGLKPQRKLASWNERPAKKAILDFVRATTDPSTKTFVPPESASSSRGNSTRAAKRSIRLAPQC